MISLGKVRGRDNNFDLIRVVAAFAVLFVHSRAISGAPAEAPPLGIGNFDSSAVAVDVFFFTSGFLVAGSLFSRANIFEFAWARVMRIFPGLWVMLFLTVTGLGLLLSTAPASEFFSSSVTRDYVLRGATLINGVKFSLPGVFEDNPYRLAVNGSLWTLPIEWRLYEYLAAGWVLLAFRPSWRRPAFRLATPAVALVLAVIALKTFAIHGERDAAQVPGAMFFYGAALQMWRDRIGLSYPRFALLVAALVLAAANGAAFFPVYLVALGPLVLHFAYLFGGPIRAYNRVGDYSYGVYIYAFPIQQTLAAVVPGISTARMNVWASVLTLACAVLSWHLVEKPALDWKLVPAAASERLFARLRDGFIAWRRRSAA